MTIVSNIGLIDVLIHLSTLYIFTVRGLLHRFFSFHSPKGRRCVLKDCCYIEDNSVLPPETVVPTFTRYSGSSAKRAGELPENTQDIMIDFTKNYYNHFTATSAPISGVSISSSVRT